MNDDDIKLCHDDVIVISSNYIIKNLEIILYKQNYPNYYFFNVYSISKITSTGNECNNCQRNNQFKKYHKLILLPF